LDCFRSESIGWFLLQITVLGWVHVHHRGRTLSQLGQALEAPDLCRNRGWVGCSAPKSHPLTGSRPQSTSQGDPNLSRAPGHCAKTIIGEILSQPFLNSLQNEASDELGLVTLGVLS
jgi:hypothetical protein